MDRRGFLSLTGRSGQCLLTGAFLGACGGASRVRSESVQLPAPSGRSRTVGLAGIGPLGPPDVNGVRLPAGFSARVVAVSGERPVAGSDYRWHLAPDGGAVFGDADGGWVYLSNSEVDNGLGGVGALAFDAAGRLEDAYPVLDGTSRNCAGGSTPWGTWLSCEEVGEGRVFECDPFGRRDAVERPALGRFVHEAAAVDPATNQIYLTEDAPDGRWYRFTPDRSRADGQPDLSGGRLEVAMNDGGRVTWLPVPDPSAAAGPTRRQVPASTAFDGGEGTCHHQGVIYFATKGDNRVWSYRIDSGELSVVYSAAAAASPILTGVDNLEVSSAGELLVAEDGGNMQIVVVTPAGTVLPLLQVVGQRFSEIAGPAFTPDGSRLYFSSQRGASMLRARGITYEITGPFAGF